jgi:hypothetical protein
MLAGFDPALDRPMILFQNIVPDISPVGDDSLPPEQLRL